jgi:hypothetical protein
MIYGDGRVSTDGQSVDTQVRQLRAAVAACVPHIGDGRRLAYIISPSQCDDGSVVDRASRCCALVGLRA